MSIPIIGNDATVIHMCQALYGMAPGYNVLTTHDAYVAANGTNSYTQALASSFNNLSDTQYAQLLMDNLGFAAVNAANPGASLSTADLAAYLTAAEGGVVNASVRGIVTLQLCNLLASFENATGAQAVYSTIATNFNSQTSNAYTYSTNSANTAPSVVSSVSAGLTVALSSGADQPSMSTSDDTITGLLGTFQSNDVIDGKGGNDTLTVRIGDGSGVVAPQVTNVETLNFIAMNDSGAVSLANMAGYTSVNIWGGSNSASLTNMTAVTVGVLSGFGGELVVTYASETGTNDNLTLNVGQASAFTLTETAFAGGNAMEALSVIAASGTGVDITTLQSSALSSVSITGSANVTMTLTLDTSRSAGGLAINATALQGNLTLALGSSGDFTGLSAGEFVINAGTGNDTIILTGSSIDKSYSGITVDGGIGNDTVVVSSDRTGATLPSLANVENLAIVATAATAGINFTGAASFGTISISGTAQAGTAFELAHMTAGATVAPNSGFAGLLRIIPDSVAGTADAITINATNVGSAFGITESAVGIENITLNFAGTGYSGGSGNFWNVGTADVTIGGSVNVKIGLHFESAFVGTGDAIVNATALGGNLTLAYDGTAHDVRINAGTGNDTINLGSAMYGGVNAVTAVVDGGAGTDTLAFQVQSGQSAMPYGNSIETVSVQFISGSEGGFANLGHVSGLTTVNVQLFSETTANSVTNIAASVATLAVSIGSGASAATGGLNLNFVSGASASMTLAGNSADAIANNEWGAINVNSAATLSLNMAGTGAQSATQLNASQATALTISVTGTGRMSFDSVSANNAGTVVLNATAGGSLFVTTASFTTAQSLTLNAAGSANTGLVLGQVAILTGKGDLTINSNNSALVTINSAIIGDDLTINAIGGDVNVSGLRIIHGTASGVDTAVNINLVAGNTGDIINLNNVTTSANGTATFTITVSGSGNVAMSGLGIETAAASGIGVSINATNLVGTLSVSANGSANYTILLGNDVNSANCAQGGAANDTIQGGANHDFIVGGAGDDNLGGGGGNDVIIGAAGADTMSGGAGNDQFAFLTMTGAAALGSLDQGTGQVDTIVDFGSGDTITFSSITAIAYSAATGATAVGSLSVTTASIIGNSGNNAAQMAIFQDSGNTIIQVAVLTGGAYVQGSGLVQIVLQGITSFTSLTSLFSVSINATNGLTITHV